MRRRCWTRIEVRIAISLGEVRVDADDVTGDAVQLALRASAFADAGEVVLTESVYLGSRTNLTLDAGGLTLSGYVDDADLVRLGGAVPSPGDKTTFTLPPAHVVALSGR